MTLVLREPICVCAESQIPCTHLTIPFQFYSRIPFAQIDIKTRTGPMHFGLGTASAELLFHVNVMGTGQELPVLAAADSWGRHKVCVCPGHQEQHSASLKG